MKRFLNIALALSLLVGTSTAASAASLGSFVDRYVAPLVNTYYGDSYYGYPAATYNPYGSFYSSPYVGYNTYNPYAGYNPYMGYGSYNPYGGWGGYYGNYGYGYNDGGVVNRLGNLLLNWF